jgi:carbonic anhydrase/acetyltransferase-like protein (isoleucine patch superfamily)
VIVSSGGKKPTVHASAFVAPTAVVSGDVTIGSGCAIMHGAVIVAEGAPVTIGSDSAIMEHAVLRASGGAAMQFALAVGERCIVGPHAYLSGATLGEGCFVSGNARILNGAVLEDDCSVGAGATVHAKARLAAGTLVGPGRIAAGDPATMYAAHEAPAEQLEAELFERVFNVAAEGDARGRIAESYAKFLRKAHARDASAGETKAPKAPVRRSGEEPPATQTTEVDKVVDVMMLELEEMEHRRQEAIRRQRER